MGFLKSLFGSKSSEKETIMTVKTGTSVNNENIGTNNTKEYQDVVLVYMAPKYKVGETRFPDSLRSKYGIGFPSEKYQELEKKGLIRPSNVGESLQYLKVTDLKEIASKHGVIAGGKKEDLCEKILSSISEDQLNSYIKEKRWVVTEKGEDLLQSNPHISFYLDKHEYELSGIGIDFNTYCGLFSINNKRQVRDVLWGEFNKRSLTYYQQAMNSGKFSDYCNLLHIMALFLKEENKYMDAMAAYVRYLYYRDGFEAGLKALNMEKYNSFEKNVDFLYLDVEMPPFIAGEIEAIKEGCGFDSVKLEAFLLEHFSKQQDTGIFTSDEMTKLIMCGLNGDKVGEKTICEKALKTALKKMKKK